jgi:hypothetical protein
MLKFWIFVVNFLTGVALAVMMVRDRLRDDTYVTKVVIDRPFDEVWPWLADPRRYVQIAPDWITSVESAAEGRYAVRHAGKPTTDEMQVELDRPQGVVDLIFGNERCQARAVRLGADRTAVMLLAKRWPDCGVVAWVRYKWTVSRDLAHAKQVIEDAAGQTVQVPAVAVR